MTKVLARYSKFIAALVGAVTEALNIGLIPHVAQNYVSIAVAILTALGVVGVSNAPSQDVVGLVNDVAAIKDQLEPLPKTGGLAGIAKWLAAQAEQHGKNLEAIAVNAEEHIKAIVVGKPVVSVGSPSPNQPQAGQDGTLKPVLEPSFDPPADATTPAAADPLAELAKLVP